MLVPSSVWGMRSSPSRLRMAGRHPGGRVAPAVAVLGLMGPPSAMMSLWVPAYALPRPNGVAGRRNFGWRAGSHDALARMALRREHP